MTRLSRSAVLTPVAVILLLACSVGRAAAAPPFVFSTFNQGALARFAPLPVPEAATPGPGARIALDWTSENLLSQSASEQIRLDGETVRLGLQYRTQWAGTLWSLELPLMLTGGGVLDSSIETWHRWFGLPNGGREQIPRNEYRYVYVRDGRTVFDINGSDATLGDLRLGAARCAADSCLRAMLQLPSGDADRLLGGGLGASLWYERGFALDTAQRWTGAIAGGAGVVRAEGPLQDQQRSLLPFGWASLGYALTARIDAGAQFYLHAPLYSDSDLDGLSSPGGQLVFGFRYRSDSGAQWRAGIQEDVITESSPDFVIHLSADWGA
ncbi:DUF3187 family protein [Sinimarinibacterium sp. CAU 1509]|uniref:DUF3187 family protein n=1 Tax=Sinimarinibacterium sp. CAU 1509 TaxID=2562283 RepID=UPI001B7F7DBC|nr:DUF3187 family protein [Sinimarinibacterium sp. CAU 1509]